MNKKVRLGEIYNVYFKYKPPHEDEGKVRPSVVVELFEEESKAIVVKITKSEPNDHFPIRPEIVEWAYSGLDQLSYADINTIEIIDISEPNSLSHRGTMWHTDFLHILNKFDDFYYADADAEDLDIEEAN